MKFKFSILNVAAGLFLAWVIIDTIFDYKQLSGGEGWGVVAMIALFGIGIALLVIDFIIQWIFKNKETVNLIGVFVLLIATILLLIK